ncbi:hypothetical protein CYY_003394 [Polysphondylium violaceum]|uniref:Uncharacterized protein n=1 Tax=Polysphondylium violaceum TaxID=133409 RepID=A0A8J4V5Z4_9MYCE|nr:hypothetical protein CYY_003394 [Polysphondylium violaceum]
MKSITICLLLALCAYYINARTILGYGDLAANNIYTIDNVNNIKYSKAYDPQPQFMLAFGGLATNASYSFNAVYTNGDQTMTWGLVNFMKGTITDLSTIHNAYPVNGLSGLSLYVGNGTLYYLGSQKTSGGNQIDFIQSNFHTKDQTTLPITISAYPAQGIYDFTSGADYFVVTITNSNQYECFWVDVITNQVIQNVVLPATSFVDSKFQIFAYQRNLYIVKSDMAGKYVEVYIVDWTNQALNLYARVQVPNQPISLQVSVIANYLAIFSTGRNDQTPTIPLINLSSSLVTDFLTGLSVSNADTYFIF